MQFKELLPTNKLNADKEKDAVFLDQPEVSSLQTDSGT